MNRKNYKTMSSYAHPENKRNLSKTRENFADTMCVADIFCGQNFFCDKKPTAIAGICKKLECLNYNDCKNFGVCANKTCKPYIITEILSAKNIPTYDYKVMSPPGFENDILIPNFTTKKINQLEVGYSFVPSTNSIVFDVTKPIPIKRLYLDLFFNLKKDYDNLVTKTDVVGKIQHNLTRYMSPCFFTPTVLNKIKSTEMKFDDREFYFHLTDFMGKVEKYFDNNPQLKLKEKGPSGYSPYKYITDSIRDLFKNITIAKDFGSSTCYRSLVEGHNTNELTILKITLPTWK